MLRRKNMKQENTDLVLQQIRQARVKEELAIPIYSSHIRQALFWSGLPLDKQKKIIERLKILEYESEAHADMLKVVENNYLKTNKQYVQ